MAEQTHDEILQAIIDKLAELDTLTKEKEELQEDVIQMQNEYDHELEKKKCELQAIKDKKAKMRVEIKKLKGTRSQLIQVNIEQSKKKMVTFGFPISMSVIWRTFG